MYPLPNSILGAGEDFYKLRPKHEAYDLLDFYLWVQMEGGF